jgi:hypothetical protein
MTIPNEVRRSVDQALAALQVSAADELKPFYRQSIYIALKRAHSSRGVQARAWLDIITVRRILPVWQSSWRSMEYDEYGYNHMPEKMVSLAEALLSSRADRTQAEKVADLAREMTDLTAEGKTSRYYLAWCVFDAALRTLIEALGYDSLEGVEITDQTSNAELESYGDAARWAAMAAAGGTWKLVAEEAFPEPEIVQWDFSSAAVRQRRRDFWEWWLREAVPAAWEAAGHGNTAAGEDSQATSNTTSE